ncbi:nucleotidyltransferase family protein [Novosphingobium aquae]|uniref:Nucleotidyltransferase family protein n=1 Tax=Novosphingobium aquae TaxID=3133435 RepID=A0ABU8S5W8_9SPHN
MTPEDITRVTPALSSSGGTALGWWRVKDTPLAAHAQILRGSAQLLALDEVARDAALSDLCALLNSAGVTPLLFKGWAAARSYPQGWLRPYGDFDLLVGEGEFAAARAALVAAATRYRGNDFGLPMGPHGHCGVDLHARLERCYATKNAALFARARAMAVCGGHLMIPSPEDHLRLCAIHLFRHGGWRPLWLCDIAAMTENAGADFDWELCLGRQRATAQWTAAAVMLAHRLLGARIDHLPAVVRGQQVPGWIEATVLRYWRNPHGEYVLPPRSGSVLAPVATIRRHWPDPVAATIRSGGAPSHGPRLLWQVARCAFTLASGVRQRFRPI